MSYSKRLTKDELTALCHEISGQAIKKLFQRNFNEFSQMKPGFRPTALSEDEAIKVFVDNVDRPFIIAYTNIYIKMMLDEIQDDITKHEEEGASYDEALAMALRKSILRNHIDLYFKLNELDAEPEYVETIRASVQDSADENSGDVVPELERQVDIQKAHLDKCLQENADLQLQLDTIHKEFTEQSEKLHDIERELEYYRSLVQFDDRTTLDDLSDKKFDYISVCEVGEPEYNGQSRLSRLADISRNGVIEPFYQIEDSPKTFGNRSKLFYKDGPTNAGIVGVWCWSAVPNTTDPTKDYIVSEYDNHTMVTEIEMIEKCTSLQELVDILKRGINSRLSTARVSFAIYVGKGQFLGIVCNKQDLFVTGDEVKLKESVISLPWYEFSSAETVRLRNNKQYFRNISIGIPSGVVRVKDPLEIVKDIIVARNTWSSFKQQGKTRSEWRVVKDFLSQLDTSSILAKISESCGCSETISQKYLDKFIDEANSYIDGDSLEDQIIVAAISVNEGLLNRCKELLKEDWENENSELIKNTSREYEVYQEKLESAKNEYQNYKELEQNKKAELQKEYEEILERYQDVSSKIEQKEKLADNVESIIAQRIQAAQNNAAEFIANMAFMPKTPIASSMTEAGQKFWYSPSIELDEDKIEKNKDWRDTIEAVSLELEEAGVMKKYTLPLAAFLHAAYIHSIPILLAGPNASDIANAYSVGAKGKLTASLDCLGRYSPSVCEIIQKEKDEIIRIENAFHGEWISVLPQLLSIKNNYYYVIHPYSEDLQIEPRSLYTYMLPLFTELFVEKTASANYVGAKPVESYCEFSGKTQKGVLAQYRKGLQMAPIVNQRIEMILSDMYAMLGTSEKDYGVLFGILSYASATMQMDEILNTIQNSSDNRYRISSDLKDYITAMYGDSNA